MKIGYARVSTGDQNLDLQIEALQQAGCERVFEEKVSGAKSDRPELGRLLDQARPGDVIVIWKFDRLGRSLKHLVDLVSRLNERRIGLQSINDPIDTTNAQGKLIFNIFASLAEFERDLIAERTQAGLPGIRGRRAQAHAGASSTRHPEKRSSLGTIHPAFRPGVWPRPET